jgi:hypothetical protein
MTIITVPCSPEQEDIILEHGLGRGQLGVLPDERAWMIAQARKQQPGCRIIGADLDIENATWVLTVE